MEALECSSIGEDVSTKLIIIQILFQCFKESLTNMPKEDIQLGTRSPSIGTEEMQTTR
jgi:hypothetical protein